MSLSFKTISEIHLKSLEEYNEEMRKIYEYHPNKPNGIACPDCGKELIDSEDLILTSYPPQKNIHCECGFRGYRIA